MMPIPDSSETCTQQFADRHIHGLAGVDFATSSAGEVREVLDLLAARRTTHVTASIPTVDNRQIDSILERLGPLVRQGALLGVHLEGPFIAPEFAGAHVQEAIVSPTDSNGQAFLQTVLEHQSVTPLVTMMTVAPEISGFNELVEQLIGHGITPALGHTAASYEQMRAGIETVHRLTGQPVVITHLYNAMRGFHHRDPGPLLAAVEAAQQNSATVELIADGHHVHMDLIAWWLDNYPAAVRLVSDASAATLPDGWEPLTSSPPQLGTQQLRYPTTTGPRLADGRTLASGAKDLLAIHQDLVAAGFEHELICGAMSA